MSARSPISQIPRFCGGAALRDFLRFTFYSHTYLRIYPLDRPRERDCLTDVFDTAHPCCDAFGAHAEA